MNNIKTLGYAGISTIAMALMAPSMSLADMSQASKSEGSSLVHRVSHSLAGSESYTTNGPSGYKWGRKVEQPESKAVWAESTASRSGYKWGDSTVAEREAQAFAGTSSYQWGVRSYAEQAGYRWGVSSYADQTGYRWGVSSYADQTGYRWGVSSYADQTGYRWGVSSYANQTGYSTEN